MESKAKKGFVKLATRKKAIGDLSDCEVELKYIWEHVEELFGAKQILDEDDWLACENENGQPFHTFVKSKDRNEVTEDRKIIYMLIADDKIDDEFQGKLVKYCRAFYTGIEVRLIQNDGEEFMKKYKIQSRKNRDTKEIQYNAEQILEKSIPLVPKDAYCMLTVTMHDIYPEQSWNYVFGLAELTERTGVFSFKRYDPAFWDI